MALFNPKGQDANLPLLTQWFQIDATSGPFRGEMDAFLLRDFLRSSVAQTMDSAELEVYRGFTYWSESCGVEMGEGEATAVNRTWIESGAIEEPQKGIVQWLSRLEVLHFDTCDVMEYLATTGIGSPEAVYFMISAVLKRFLTPKYFQPDFRFAPQYRSSPPNFNGYVDADGDPVPMIPVLLGHRVLADLLQMTYNPTLSHCSVCFSVFVRSRSGQAYCSQRCTARKWQRKHREEQYEREGRQVRRRTRRGTESLL